MLYYVLPAVSPAGVLLPVAAPSTEHAILHLHPGGGRLQHAAVLGLAWPHWGRLQLGELQLGDGLGLGVGSVGPPPGHSELAGERDWVCGVWETHRHDGRAPHLSVQGHHRDVIDRTQYIAQLLSVARVDLEISRLERDRRLTKTHINSGNIGPAPLLLHLCYVVLADPDVDQSPLPVPGLDVAEAVGGGEDVAPGDESPATEVLRVAPVSVDKGDHEGELSLACQ